MPTPGNHKLGDKLIWGFGLPSGRAELCTGMTTVCRQHCYARRLESYRPNVLARYEENYRLSQRSDFEQRLYHFLLAHEVHVVRIHSDPPRSVQQLKPSRAGRSLPHSHRPTPSFRIPLHLSPHG